MRNLIGIAPNDFFFFTVTKMSGTKEYDVSLRSRATYGLLWKENLEKKKREREICWLDFIIIVTVKQAWKKVH